MNFSETEDSSEESALLESVAESKEPGALLSVCSAVWLVKQARERIRQLPFSEREHPSAYNLYVRERDRLGGKSARCLEVFAALVGLGVKCRLVYSVSVEKAPKVLEALEILMGTKVITEGEKNPAYISLSVAYDRTVVNHSLYVPKRVAAALNLNFPHGSASSGAFGEHDRQGAAALPQTKREALLHPLYAIETHRRREVIYPRGCGWVGTLKDRSAQPTLKSKRQQARELRIYPISHSHRLLTLGEITARNKVLEPGAVPFRVFKSAAASQPNTLIRLYAPWQMRTGAAQLPTLITPQAIPEDSVYLVETQHLGYTAGEGVSEGGGDSRWVVPVIGRAYNPATNRMESVSAGVLLPASEYQARKAQIKTDVLKSILTRSLTANKNLLINLQVFSKKALEYLDILDTLQHSGE